MSAAHIQIAQGTREFEGRTGPKAAFDFYMQSKVHTAKPRQAEIRSAGNKKAQFPAYCAIFGSQFGAVTGNGAVRSNEQVEDVRESLTDKLRKAAELLGLTVTEAVPVVEAEVVPAKREIPKAERISFLMAMALRKIATTTGQEFVITGKTGGEGTSERADYSVTLDGRKLNPSQASAIIAAAKA